MRKFISHNVWEIKISEEELIKNVKVICLITNGSI